MAVGIVDRHAELLEDFANQRLTGANASCDPYLKGRLHWLQFNGDRIDLHYLTVRR